MKLTLAEVKELADLDSHWGRPSMPKNGYNRIAYLILKKNLPAKYFKKKRKKDA